VCQVFVEEHTEAQTAFVARGEKYLADIYQLARLRLERVGIRHIYGGGFDTVTESRWYSYRRNPNTGRMASLIWINP
jgi:polyphenol oxidase